MKKQTVFALLVVLALALSSCGTTPPAAPTTPTLLPTQQTVIPTDITYPTFTPTPLATAISYPTVTPLPTEIPYPTASVVNANAVAFIAEGALWVVNVDGSGEKKLVDNIHNKDLVYDLMFQWAPNGKWISYFSQDKLWAISVDGLVNKSLLSLPDNCAMYLTKYAWSPDSSKIAYLEETLCNAQPTTPAPSQENNTLHYLIGIIDIAAGTVSKLSSFETKASTPILFWLPNGRNLLFAKGFSLALFDISTRKVVKEMERGCGLEKNMTLSPNGQWYSYTDNGVGVLSIQWICVGGLNSPTHKIQVDGTTDIPVWDKTGSFLYFFASDISITPLPDYDRRLMRYNVITQKLERVVSIEKEIDWLSISPDGETLELHYPNQNTFILIDTQSLKKHEINVNSDIFLTLSLNGGTAWTSDKKNIIFSLIAGSIR